MLFWIQNNTFSTIKGTQEFGSSFFKVSVVIQKDALVVFEANSLYFFE